MAGKSSKRRFLTAQQVEGLRELLNEPESDDEPDTGHTSVSSAPTHVPYEKRLMNSLFVFSGDIEATDLRWLHPPGPHIDALSDVYWDRVDIIFKILHRPTFEPLLKTAAQDAASIPKGAGYEALMFAMYFAAVTSLTAEECTALLGKDRTNLASQFRHCCEISLANADFLNSTDLQVLQAFSLYLVSRPFPSMFRLQDRPNASCPCCSRASLIFRGSYASDVTTRHALCGP